MKFMLFLFVLLVAFTKAVGAAETLRTYDCEVVGFATSGDDKDFNQANLEKRFIVQIGDSEIHTTITSKKFNDSRQKHQIFHKQGNEIYGASVSAVSTSVLAFNEFYFDGAYRGSVSRQSYLYGNVWELSCQKI